MELENTSEKYQLNKVDTYKILRGAGITLASALITYIGQVYLNIDYTITTSNATIDLGPFAIVIIGAALETGRRFIANYSDK